MSIGQKIYQAIERLAVAPRQCNEFKNTFSQSLVHEGADSGLAEHLAAVAQDALANHRDNDHHLGMVELIAMHPEFGKLMLQDIAATTALHKYMSFYLDLEAMQPACAVNH
ncbi:hypothetical protein [uncultured Microbulbifer sp.]|uniref:hypothetical protein n=1 Tax=uncultured Microbulbifer sp. TaxID=348147 RepID=UPI0025F60F4E|nr:hypothetical protein [uncultured Microbulbifer sp.]